MQKLKIPKIKSLISNSRSLWGYVEIAFNKVDQDRLQIVGPDRLCAEWVIKNGGAARFAGNTHPIKDYNLLPEDKQVNMSSKLVEIDATDASIMKLGFEHFKGCTAIEKIVFNRCKSLENDALKELHYIQNTLKDIQVSSCYNFQENGLIALKDCKQLKTIRLYDFPYVKDLAKVVRELKAELPGCNIILHPKDEAETH